jgi:hypothetical protein
MCGSGDEENERLPHSSAPRGQAKTAGAKAARTRVSAKKTGTKAARTRSSSEPSGAKAGHAGRSSVSDLSTVFPVRAATTAETILPAGAVPGSSGVVGNLTTSVSTNAKTSCKRFPSINDSIDGAESAVATVENREDETGSQEAMSSSHLSDEVASSVRAT